MASEVLGIALAELLEGAPADACGAALELLTKLCDNAAADHAKFGTVKRSSKALQSRLLGLSSGAAALLALGFTLDEAADAYVAPAEDVLRASADVARGLQYEHAALVSAITAVGDRNAPEVALGAHKLMLAYLSNLAADPTKKTINASNKALNARLLPAAGGATLLSACGFAQRGDAYENSCDELTVRCLLATLKKAEAIWASLAADAPADLSGGAAGGGGGGGGGGEPAEEATAEPLGPIVLSALRGGRPIGAPKSRADMQPALVREADSVEVHAWLAVSQRWQRVGAFELPSTQFGWERRQVHGGAYELYLEVDLGDGKPLPLGVGVSPGGELENEYVAAQRFIHSAPLEANIDNAWLETVARKIRGRVEPVLAAVAQLRAAIEAQN